MGDHPSNTITSFRGLGGNRARAEFLHDLVSELSPYERRELRDVLNQETHQRDFVSSLPLELVHVILQYLDVSELFSLRRVSICWYQRLASPNVCKTILRRDFPEEAALVDNNYIDPTTRLFSKAQQRHAFRTGRPYSKAWFPIKLPLNHTPPAFEPPVHYFDYHDGKFVWVDYSTGTAVARIRNLSNGRQFSITPVNREAIIQVKISDTLVAIITGLGACHVYDLDTEEGHFFQLPSPTIVRMSVAARRVAVVGAPPLHDFASVLVRDFDTQKTRILNVGLGSDSIAQSIVLHPNGDAFYLINRRRRFQAYNEAGRSSSERIDFLKFDFQGEMTFKRECWGKSEWISEHWIWDPTGSGSHHTIPLGTKYIGLDPKTKNSPVYQDHCIDYDMQSDRVTYDKTTRRVREAQYGSSQPERSGPLRQNMRWKDVTYFAWYKARHLDAILVQHVDDTSSAWKTEILDIHRGADAEKRSARIMLYGDYVDDYWLVGDERFLVSINFEEVQVWCFDKDLVMPGEERHYRVERTKRADVRAAERRLQAMKT